MLRNSYLVMWHMFFTWDDAESVRLWMGSYDSASPSTLARGAQDSAKPTALSLASYDFLQCPGLGPQAIPVFATSVTKSNVQAL